MANDMRVTSSPLKLEDPASLTGSTARMAVAMSGLVAQWLRGLTINAHERLALAHLWEHGPMTMSDLGARIPLSRAAVTALTDRLEALGYVQRTPDAHDRRRTVLSLNQRPQQLIEPMIGRWEQEIDQVENSFSSDEQRAIVRWNDAMRDLAHRHAAPLRDRGDAELPSPSPVA